MIRVKLPAHLRNMAGVDGEVMDVIDAGHPRRQLDAGGVCIPRCAAPFGTM